MKSKSRPQAELESPESKSLDKGARFGSTRHRRITRICQNGCNRRASDWTAPPAGIELLCDEAQHLPEKDRELSDLFAGVHNNRGKGAPPIMQVFAGLEDSKHVLDTLGLSRINKIHGVGQFEPGEAHEAAYAAVDDLRRAGMRAGNDNAAPDRMDWWAREFARQSDDWPQHVAACMRGLAQAMLEKNEDHLMRMEPADVGERAARLRAQYYDARLDATEPIPLEISAALHAALRKRNGALSKTAALVSIDEAVCALPEPIRVELTADLSGPNAILRRLARAGVVSVSSGRRDVTSPIPSLGRHILHLADDPPPAQPIGWQPELPR